MTEELLLNFLLQIGIGVRIGEIDHTTFLPGIHIEKGGLVVDRARLRYPGDLLHEAGHLALMDPARRAGADGNVGDDGGEELGAIAWSYAAALHLGIDPRVVFHADGYHGGSESILKNFAGRHYFGVPLLEWKGLTASGRRAVELGVAPYPHMLRWLCE